MNLYNPYEPPRAGDAAYPAAARGDSSEVPEPIVELLRQTRPWVLFLAILGFVGTGLMILIGLGVMLMGPSAKLPAAMGLIYVALGALYLFPSLYLFRYGSSIGRLLREPQVEQLTTALGHQKSFWKMVGIMTAVMVALYPVVIVVALVVGFSRVR